MPTAFDPREAATDLNRAACRGEGGDERIVAASVEEHHRDPAVALKLLQHEVELDCLEVEVGIGLKLGVHGREEVLSVDLEAVAGIEEEAYIGASELRSKRPDALLHLLLGEVIAVDHVEAELPERGRHIGRIVAGIFQRRGVLVSRIPDDESDALLGSGRSEGTEEQKSSGETGSEILEHGGSSINSGPCLPPSESGMNPG
jgi:hypothetical protein